MLGGGESACSTTRWLQCGKKRRGNEREMKRTRRTGIMKSEPASPESLPGYPKMRKQQSSVVCLKLTVQKDKRGLALSLVSRSTPRAPLQPEYRQTGPFGSGWPRWSGKP